MKKKEARINAIMARLHENDVAYVSELAAQLNVTEMTIRRDLEELRASGVIERSHGKARLLRNGSPSPYENIENEYSLLSASATMNREKELIARRAAGIIEPNDVIILDNGSTIHKMLPHIPFDKQLTVVCYNLNILAQLPHNGEVDILFAGGYFHPSDQMFESPENITFLRTIRANKLFLSASGVHATLGMTCAHDFEVSVKQAVIQSSLTKVLVADSSKFGALKTVCFAQLDDVDVIVTDSGLSADWIGAIKEKGIKLEIVETPNNEEAR